MAMRTMSALSPLSGVERTSSQSAATSGFDPTATLAGHCGNRFDADSNPYQSTHLSRYNNDAS
jgi:hypothetical protein